MEHNQIFMLAQTGAPTTPAGNPQPQGAPAWGMLPMLLFMLAAFYFLLWRPQAKQRKEHAKLLSEIKSGDKVVTSAGMHGVVTNVKDKTFVIRIADGVKVEFDKSSISRVSEKSSDGGGGEEKSK
jgi:preprotein translocase subunit YajC